MHKIFYPHDADIILELSAPRPSRKDFLAWHCERRGLFSVKSAYRLAYNLKNKIQEKDGSSWLGDNNRNLWKMIWNAPVPSKVKNLWLENRL